MPRNKNCIENSIQKEELKNNQEESLINNDTFYFKRGATFFDGIKKKFCNNKKNTIENKEINTINNIKSRKYKLIKLITMCAIMMLFNVAFSNLAYALEISTEEEFRAFASSVKSNNTYEGQVVNINADINLNNTPLMPINNFAGTLDGHGHTISGLSVTTGEYRGLFGQITASPTIKNLTLEGKIEANVSSYAAGFAAYVSGSPTFENCVNKVEVKGINTSVGGFIGAIQNTNTPNIINCYNEGNLTR